VAHFLFLDEILCGDVRMSSKQARLQLLLEPVVQAQGCELWALDYRSQGRRDLLRLFIDSEAGVTLEDCEKVSRQVSSVLDVEDPITSGYILEVSSPGLDRPLYTPAHFQRFAGQQVKIRLCEPFQGRRNIVGLLVGMEGDDVIVRCGENDLLLPVDSIDKANLVPTF
jgi:ribosome maturation factor RimP